MKRLASALLLAFLLAAPASASGPALPTPLTAQVLGLYFSPGGGATEAIVRTLGQARESLYVQAYSFTSPSIAQAIMQAHARGIKVEVILDKSQRTEKYSGATYLANAGVPVFIDDAHAIAHNKVMVVDDQIVITGSFNFTKSAEERNAENLLILRNPELARAYLDNWLAHRKHSGQYNR